MSLYSKTSLKKIKKDDLIQMFLDLQAQKVNDSMDQAVEKCCNNAIEEVIEDLKAENEKLKKQKDGWVQRSKKVRESYDECVYKKVEIIKELREENEKLKGCLEELYTLREGEIAHLGQIDLLKHEISKLKEKEQVKDINGKDVKVPSEAECRALFGVSKEEYIMLAKNSDCNYD